MKFLTLILPSLFFGTINAVQRVRVGLDRGAQISSDDPNDKLFADDLTGCSVIAARWPLNSVGSTNAIYFHLCGATISDANKFEQIVNDDDRVEGGISMKETLDIIVQTLGQPRDIWLVIATVGGSPQFPEGNQRIRDFLSANGITATIQQRTYRGNSNEALVQLFPSDTQGFPLTISQV